MPRPRNQPHVLLEPAPSKIIWTSENNYFVENFQESAAPQKSAAGFLRACAVEMRKE
jgi:hypothetical protein